MSQKFNVTGLCIPEENYMVDISEKIPYNADAYAVNVGIMFGFLKNDQKVVAVSNRIFETRMYDMAVV